MLLYKALKHNRRRKFIALLSHAVTLYFVLHPLAQKAISGNSANFEANMAAEWTDRQTICRFWLGLRGGVIEEDGASEVCHAVSTHTAWRNSKLSHPGGQKHSGCKALSLHTHACTNTHTHTHIDAHTSCLPADCGYCRSVSGPSAMGRWLAGKWLLCLQHGRQIQAHTVLDLKLYLSCINLD